MSLIPFPSQFRRWLYSACLLCLAFVPAINAQSTWEPRSSGTSKPLTGVAYGGGKFVAVGDTGVIVSSDDGETWSTQTSGTSQDLRGIAYGNGLFVATGIQGTALTSPTGVVWTARDARTAKFLSGATFGNGLFVAVGGSGTIRYSADGINWELGISPTSSFFQSVSFGDGKFVAVGASGKIATSTDGQSWGLAASGTSSSDYCTGTTYIDGTYIVTGQSATVHTSADASNWVFQSSVQAAGVTDWLRAATTNGSRAVVVGDNGRILSSSNGVDWTEQSSGATADLNAACYGAGMYVVVGEATGAPAAGLILTSVDDDVPPPFTFESWRQEGFTASELDDLLISGPDADPDCDGISNFAEYAYGLPHDLATGLESLPQLSKVGGGDSLNHIAITFCRPANRAGIVSYSARTSIDLQTWVDLVAVEEILAKADGVQTVRIVDPDPLAGTKFYQLVVAAD